MSTGGATTAARDTVTGEDRAAAVVWRTISPPIFVEAAESPLYWGSAESYVADLPVQSLQPWSRPGGTASVPWERILREITSRVESIWDTPRLVNLLAHPLGSPVELTKEEAREVVRLAGGRRPDLTPGRDYVRRVRALLGHSILRRARR